MSLNEWNMNPDPETLAYHMRHKEREESTKAFADFIQPLMDKHKPAAVTDIGCGSGSATAYLQDRFTQSVFYGMDISDTLIRMANMTYPHIPFFTGDACRLRKDWHAQGVVSLQTFSWMSNIERPLGQIVKHIKPKFIAFSSLFYEGDISARIVIDEPKRPRKSYYNVYSIPRLVAFMKERGYWMINLRRFDLNKDIPQPDNLDLMKTYTLPIEHGGYLQISGPIMLPWYFLAFEKMT